MRLPLLLCLASLTLLVPARAERRREESPASVKVPPQPVPATLSVARGGRVEIPLRAYGLPSEPPRFVLRTRPEKGKLTAPKEAPRDSATVTYEPPADLAVKSEKFTYAVQNSAGVSAAATITITITDEPVHLITPREIEFTKVPPGTTARQEFEIANLGGSLAAGEVVAAQPWRVEGSPAYRLKAGERQKLTLLFQPAASGLTRGDLRFTSQPELAVPVSGETLAQEATGTPLPVIAGGEVAAAAPALAALPAPPEPEPAVNAPPVKPRSAARPVLAIASVAPPAAAEEPAPIAAPESRKPALRIVVGTRVSAHTANSVDVRWPVALSGGEAVRVEYRSGLSLDAQHHLLQTWAPWTKFHLRTEKDDVIATMYALQPATVYTFRILPAAAEAAPLFTIDAATAKGESTAVFTKLRVGFGALFIFGAAALWRRFRAPAV